MRFITLTEFLSMPESKDGLWSYMGRKNNAGHCREWYVAICGRTHNGCSGYIVADIDRFPEPIFITKTNN